MKSEPRCAECPAFALGVFGALPAKERKNLDRIKVSHLYHAGEILFNEGNEPREVFFLREGRIKISKSGLHGEEVMLRLLGPGAIIGYRPLLAGEPYAATAEAVEPSLVCSIAAQRFIGLIRGFPDLALRILEELARELRVSEEELLIRTLEPVPRRAARLILWFLDSRPEGAGPPQFTVPVPRADLAGMIGTAPETLSRTLQDFTRAGLLEVEGRRFRVLDLDALRNLADG
ncbi:MAG: Crp/Fnr family transcriptional regulator [Candidatus Eisenbacteria bacterium]|nr:Crp/Fnr family transcriptional regulator [Candidatus Eisenbacteria bacterium]